MKMPWEFKVKEVRLIDIPDLKEVKGIERDKILINADEHTRLGVVSNDYSVFPHSEAVNKTVEAINEVAKVDSRFKNFKLNSDKVVLRRNKSFMKLDVDFPDLKFVVGKVKKVDDIVGFRTSILNSLDGTSRLKWPIGGFRVVCSNGLVTFQEIDSISFVHKGLNIPSLKESILNELKTFQHLVNEWKELAKKSLTKEQISEVFKKMKERNEKERVIAVKHLNNIIDISDKIFEEEGRTVWTLYNLASNYTTHNQKIANSVYVIDREKEISKFFLDMAKAA